MNPQSGWLSGVDYNPLPVLLECPHPSIRYFTRRDLLASEAGDIEVLWELPEPVTLLKHQLQDGSWKYPGPVRDFGENYSLLETFRSLGILVEKYGFNRRHPSIPPAAEYLFAHQTDEGDIRGMFGTQYVPHYHAGMLELLCKAGYENDERVKRGIQWLLACRQDDGGWAFPIRTAKIAYYDAVKKAEPIRTDPGKPFSHLMTGIALRAFAAHPEYRKHPAAIKAGELLASRFFQADKYVDRRTPDYWEKVTFPFWFTDIVSALDSLSLLGFTLENADIRNALEKISSRQQENGLFDFKLLKGKGENAPAYWICLAICRSVKRMMETDSGLSIS